MMVNSNFLRISFDDTLVASYLSSLIHQESLSLDFYLYRKITQDGKQANVTGNSAILEYVNEIYRLSKDHITYETTDVDSLESGTDFLFLNLVQTRPILAITAIYAAYYPQLTAFKIKDDMGEKVPPNNFFMQIIFLVNSFITDLRFIDFEEILRIPLDSLSGIFIYLLEMCHDDKSSFDIIQSSYSLLDKQSINLKNFSSLKDLQFTSDSVSNFSLILLQYSNLFKSVSSHLNLMQVCPFLNKLTNQQKPTIEIRMTDIYNDINNSIDTSKVLYKVPSITGKLFISLPKMYVFAGNNLTNSSYEFSIFTNIELSNKSFLVDQDGIVLRRIFNKGYLNLFQLNEESSLEFQEQGEDPIQKINFPLKLMQDVKNETKIVWYKEDILIIFTSLITYDEDHQASYNGVSPNTNRHSFFKETVNSEYINQTIKRAFNTIQLNLRPTIPAYYVEIGGDLHSKKIRLVVPANNHAQRREIFLIFDSINNIEIGRTVCDFFPSLTGIDTFLMLNVIDNSDLNDNYSLEILKLFFYGFENISQPIPIRKSPSSPSRDTIQIDMKLLMLGNSYISKSNNTITFVCFTSRYFESLLEKKRLTIWKCFNNQKITPFDLVSNTILNSSQQESHNFVRLPWDIESIFKKTPKQFQRAFNLGIDTIPYSFLNQQVSYLLIKSLNNDENIVLDVVTITKR